MLRWFLSLGLLCGIWKTIPPAFQDLIIFLGSVFLFFFIVSVLDEIDEEKEKDGKSPSEENPTNQSPTP